MLNLYVCIKYIYIQYIQLIHSIYTIFLGQAKFCYNLLHHNFHILHMALIHMKFISMHYYKY